MAKKEVKNDKKKNKKVGFLGRFWSFLKSVWYELKKVTWPTRKELVKQTSVVIAIVLITTLTVWLIDFGIGGILSLII